MPSPFDNDLIAPQSPSSIEHGSYKLSLTQISERTDSPTTTSDEAVESSKTRPASRKRQSRSLVVELRPRLQYVPGSGPALQPPRLALPPLTTAFIIERILLPSLGLAADGRPLPKRMTYIVGWHDLPAASLLVPAMQILDYVSQRALEDWEDSLEAEIAREQNLVHEENAGRAGKRRKTAHKSHPPPHTGIQQAAAVEPAAETLHHPKRGSMSLSTPQKRKLADFAGLSDDEDTPTHQLARETFDIGTRTEPVSLSGSVVTDESDSSLDRKKSATAAAARPDSVLKNAPPRIITPVPFPSYVSKLLAQRAGESVKPTPSGVRLEMDGNAAASNTDQDTLRSIEGIIYPSGFSPINGDCNSSTKTSRTDSPTEDARRSASDTKASKPPTPARKKLKATPTDNARSESNAQASWEVDRLENQAFYEVQGRGVVRYFLVRWTGTWPPEQNPTWEPEENIPKDLVRQYTKLSRDRRARLAAQSRKPPPDQIGSDGGDTGLRLGAVSAAFEACIIENPGFEDDTDEPSRRRRRGLYFGEDGEREIFVVDDSRDQKRRMGKQTPIPLPPTAFGIY